MDVLIVSGNGRSTLYKPSELIKDARRLIKGKGKLVDYFVRVNETSGRTQLVATYQQANGWRGQESEVI